MWRRLWQRSVRAADPTPQTEYEEEEEVRDREPRAALESREVAESLDMWAEVLRTVVELRALLQMQNFTQAVNQARSAELSLREVVMSMARTGRTFYENEEPSPESEWRNVATERACAIVFGAPLPNSQQVVCEIRESHEDTTFTCPIGLEAMRDPVLASDGLFYDRVNIVKAMESSPCSPVTRSRITRQVHRSNLVRQLMREKALLLATEEENKKLLE